MSTPFTTILPPPGRSVLSHPLDDSITASSIPQAFTEALSVRLAVYVDEQHCTRANEIDADDPRSWHWIAYASVSGPKTPTPESSPAQYPQHRTSTQQGHVHSGTAASGAGTENEQQARRPSGFKLPVATLRLIPPPHGLHPAPGSVDGMGGTWPSTSTKARSYEDRATTMHDSHEPYVKLGRLATLKEYRGLGLGRMLVTTALDWAARNAEVLRVDVASGENEFVGEGVAREREAQGRLGLGEEWKGLVLVHAQMEVQGFWGSFGFERDEELGVWVEEGIAHIGMWKRVALV